MSNRYGFPPRRGIKIYEPPSIGAPESNLTTKRRLAKEEVTAAHHGYAPVPGSSSKRRRTEGGCRDDGADLNVRYRAVRPKHGTIPYAEIGTLPPPLFPDQYEGLWWNEGDEGNEVEEKVVEEPVVDPYREANTFLSGIELQDEIQSRFQKPMNRPVRTDYRPSMPRYQPAPSSKPWAWKGRVTISVSGHTETLCEKAILTDSTGATVPRLANFVLSTKDLEFTACYDIADLYVFFRKFCQAPREFARLIAEGTHADTLRVFSQYLTKKRQVVMIRAHWDERLVGFILFVPSTAEDLLKYLDAAPGLNGGTALVAVLLLMAADALPVEEKFRDLPRLQRRIRIEPSVVPREQWLQSVLREPDYHVGLRIVQLPTEVREFILTHTSTVWFDCTVNDRENEDTKHLLHVLTKFKPGVVLPTNTSADIVFIHVGALSNLRNFPHLAHRRLRPEVRFCLYGTHRTLPPLRWGFREVYLLGGVVTFTPKALVEDALGVFRAIRNIDAHPLWVCYLLPQVLGMAVKLSQQREDYAPESYTGMLPNGLARIVNAVEKGQVALVRAPPNSTSTDTAEVRQWVADHGLFRPMTTNDILERCTKAFEDVYGSSPKADWTTFCREDIMADMHAMQAQPSLLEYRRFVVVDSSVHSPHNSLSHAVEWIDPRNFAFQDGFSTEEVCGGLV
ncbi:hypothetical protein C8R47DRAFT_108330 [Mycena vitilis]|nr:hypothetical protein C8R47DRAFT_108330 [Mycena vitilis]